MTTAWVASGRIAMVARASPPSAIVVPHMTQGRMDKTVDKMRRGGLPVPTEHTRVVALGDGRPCDGCSETIDPTEAQWTIRVVGGLEWRLHEECYTAWSTFTR